MKKYTIDYEHGKAFFLTSETDPKKVVSEFCEAAGECFGIRKSLGEIKIEAVEDVTLTHAIFHSGDSILFDNSKGDWKKIITEWENPTPNVLDIFNRFK